MQDQLFFLFSALLAGVVLGAVLMYYLSSSSSKNGKTLEKVEKDLEDYKHDVAIHFETTANLVEELTQNYKKVFDHLGQSAKHLMSEEELKNQIEKRKGNRVTLEFLNDENTENDNHDDDSISPDEITVQNVAEESTENSEDIFDEDGTVLKDASEEIQAAEEATAEIINKSKE